jgi:hypothetical protein
MVQRLSCMLQFNITTKNKTHLYLFIHHTIHDSFLKSFANNMDSTNYCEIVYNTFLPFLEDSQHVPFRDFILHQDNSPIHKSNQCKQFLEALNIHWVT